MISAYCLDYCNWVCIPRHVKRDFAEMVDMGFDTVCLSFSESEMNYSRRTFEILVELAHEAGLKVHVIPSRIAGRFAGAPYMPSMWLSKHPEYTVPGDEHWAPVGCLECEPVREWIKDFVKTLIVDYDIDGIVWDEPKAPTLISRHPDTVRKYGPNPTEEDMADGFCEFFEELTEFCHNLKPELTQTLFCLKRYPEYFTAKVSKTRYLDYFGYDGNLCRQRRFHEDIYEDKYRITEVWNRTVKECEAAGKKTFALIESMMTPREEHETFERNLNDFLANHQADNLALYYYAHNADAPEELNDIIKRAMKKHLKK